jgi:kanamycin nucleotidyltransferase
MPAAPASDQLAELCAGPVAQSRVARLALAQRVADRAEMRFGSDFLFCALYGSVAREADGAYSDVELFCACSSGKVPCQVYEWIEAGIKVKLRVYTEAGLIAETAMVDMEWPLSHNKIFHHRLLAGTPASLEMLQHLAANADAAAFAGAITHIYLAEVYELTAKLHNLRQAPDSATQGAGPVLIKLLEQVSIILGMAERRCFSTRQQMLTEAVGWRILPGAFPLLCQLVLAGNLQEGIRSDTLLEQLWQELGGFLRSRKVLTPSAISVFY